MKKTLLALALVASIGSQAQTVAWKKVVEGKNELTRNDIALNADGQLLLVANFSQEFTFDNQMYSVNTADKTLYATINSDGTVASSETRDRSDYSQFHGADYNSVLDHFIVGGAERMGGIQRPYVYALDENYNQTYSSNLGGTANNSVLNHLVSSKDGKFYYASVIDYSQPGKALITKFDNTGNESGSGWTFEYSGDSDIRFQAVDVDEDDNLYLVGNYQGLPNAMGLENSVGEWDSFILKVNSAGIFEWVYHLGKGVLNDYAFAVHVTEDNVYVGGANTMDVENSIEGEGGDFFEDDGDGNTLSGNREPLVYKLDLAGNMLDSLVLPTNDDSEIRTITSDDCGNIYLGGNFRDTITFNDEDIAVSSQVSSGFIAKVNEDLDEEWFFLMESDDRVHVEEVLVDNNSNAIYAVGNIRGNYTIGTQEENSPNLSGSNFEVYVTKITQNQSPSEISLDDASIDEHQGANVEVGILMAEDCDHDEHMFRMVEGEGDDDNDAFSIQDDVLMANESLDFETKASYTIRVEAADIDGGLLEDIIEIMVNDVDEATVSIAEASNKLGVYPNPTSDRVIVEFPFNSSDILSVSLTSVDGKMSLQPFTLQEGNLEMNVSSLVAGLYFIQVQTNDEVYTSSVMVK